VEVLERKGSQARSAFPRSSRQPPRAALPPGHGAQRHCVQSHRLGFVTTNAQTHFEGPGGRASGAVTFFSQAATSRQGAGHSQAVFTADRLELNNNSECVAGLRLMYRTMTPKTDTCLYGQMVSYMGVEALTVLKFMPTPKLNISITRNRYVGCVGSRHRHIDQLRRRRLDPGTGLLSVNLTMIPVDGAAKCGRCVHRLELHRPDGTLVSSISGPPTVRQHQVHRSDQTAKRSDGCPDQVRQFRLQL